MPVKPFTPQRIVQIEDGQYGVVFSDTDDAKMCLRKNPRATYLPQENGEVVLVYGDGDIDLKRAIVRR